MAGKLTIRGPKDSPKLESDPNGVTAAQTTSTPVTFKAGSVPSKPLFTKLVREATESLSSGKRDERTLVGSTAGGGFLKLRTQKEAEELQSKSRASRELFAGHTVSEPSSSYQTSRKVLDAFFDEAKDLSPAQLTRLATSRPELLDAALDFLSYRFTPVGFAEVGRDPDAKRPTQVALRLVQEMDEPRRARFLESVVFNVAHPANHLALWPSVVASVPAEQLEKALLEKAGSQNELHALNAFALPFHVYGRKPGYGLSDGARQTLTQLAQSRLADPGTNLLLRQNLDDFVLPQGVT